MLSSGDTLVPGLHFDTLPVTSILVRWHPFGIHRTHFVRSSKGYQTVALNIDAATPVQTTFSYTYM